MTDQEKNDHWANLAENVGATPPPDSSPAEQSDDENEVVDSEDVTHSATGWNPPDSEKTDDANDSPDVKPDMIEVEPRKVRSYRPKSGWEELADEFDLPKPEKAPEKEQEDQVATEPVAEHPAGSEIIESSDSSEEISPADEVPVDRTADMDQPVEDEGPSLGTGEFEALFEGSLAAGRKEGAGDEDERPSFEEAIVAASRELEKERAEEEKDSGRRRKKRRRRPRKKDSEEESIGDKGDDETAGQSSTSRQSEEDVAAEEIDAADSDGFGAGLFGEDTSRPSGSSESQSATKSSEAEEGGRKRGRRRRRRGSSRKKEAVSEVSVDAEPVLDDATEEEISDKPRRRGTHKKRAASDREDGPKGRRDRSEKESSDKEKKAVSHRGIPSWDEAIEHIIDTNMGNRSKKPGSNSSSRSRGGKGRSGREKSSSRKRSG